MKPKDWKIPTIPSKIKPKPKSKKKPAKNSLEAVLGSDTRLYIDLQEHREDEWRTTVLAFEANPSVHNAYWYIAQHPMFWYFTEAWNDGRAPRVHERHLVSDEGWKQVRITPVMVNPRDRRISNDVHLNTQVEFWWEFGPTLFRENGGLGISGHDQLCDGGTGSRRGGRRDEADGGGDDTYDAAIVGVAKKIHKVYGNDRRHVVKQWNDPVLPQEKK